MAGAAPSPPRSTHTASASRQSESSPTLAVGCVRPIRLRGFYQRIAAHTGEVLATIGSAEKGDGVLLVSCKDRRASCCPPCARLYERDAYQLLAAGLRGGKGVPATVGSHPLVMLTLTAPSFGVVHSRDGSACRCGRDHGPDDPQLGTPIDPVSYRYADQVIWNHYAPRLWKRTVQVIRRGLAEALGLPGCKLSEVARVRFAKVAEFQRRGVVHYHALVRVDGSDDADHSAPLGCTTKVLADVVAAAAEAAAISLRDPVLAELVRGVATLRWGAQRDIVALDHETSTKAAGYIAKYATKATETTTGGTLIKPIHSRDELDQLQLGDHARSLIAAAWTIGQRTDLDGFKRWAHQFGYGGHTLTKSHEYSVTFAALRAARLQWRQTMNDEGEVVIRSQLTYAGRGHTQVRRMGAVAAGGRGTLPQMTKRQA